VARKKKDPTPIRPDVDVTPSEISTVICNFCNQDLIVGVDRNKPMEEVAIMSACLHMTIHTVAELIALRTMMESFLNKRLVESPPLKLPLSY